MRFLRSYAFGFIHVIARSEATQQSILFFRRALVWIASLRSQ